MENGSSPLHVVIFPWLAFGHLLPFLDLAERLAARGHRVSFVSTPRNLARLRPVRPALRGLVDLVALPLPRVDGLPDGAEATSDVPFEKFELHRKAFDGLAAPFSAFLDAACAGDKRPDWVIPDFMHYWVAAAAQKRGVPCAVLIPCSADVMALYGQPTETSTEQPEAIARSMAAEAPSFEAERNTEEYGTAGASGVSIMTRFSLTLKWSKLVALRSCPELEPGVFTTLTRVYSKPVVPFGLLPPRRDGAHGVRKNGEDDGAIIRWLDEQPAKSVVYVALGSEAPVSADLLRELAHGLELAGTRFLWALRRPAGVNDGDSILPNGFLERTGERGLVTTGWVPQVSILAHAAVCAFLTHCGWGSVVEGLQFGHPLIMLPIIGDQGPNARFLEGRKVGVAVPRNHADGSFDRSGVAGAVRAVAVEEEGKAFAANARKLQEIVADRERDERCTDGFIHHLTSWNELEA
ncbi:UDP-glycosyltransferase 91B1-like [Oryza brachyantha]|uniref:UDP-glycosyltransferase 91B1-like n=1 Tax=Oryza brachyantha TaxID=4533 RepID=UPI001ADA1C04|nr:UDP-glycosyltransferase 91B1-like [Oryza brachyantha]